MNFSSTSSRTASRGILILVVAITMIAFAGNSVLGRMALRPTAAGMMIDPATYSLVRIVSGVVMLCLIQAVRHARRSLRNRDEPATGSRLVRLGWLPLLLAVYAVFFSFAYVRLDAASGTLILFAWVQLTMVLLGVMRGEIPRIGEVCGLVIASGGLAYLVYPNLQTPDFRESILMSIAGIAWGGYSWLGKGSQEPVRDTTLNFALAIPWTILLGATALAWVGQPATAAASSDGTSAWPGTWSLSGVGLAVLSGSIASGVGYVLWYTALPALRSTQAAAIQLCVPVLAGWGGIWIAGDEFRWRIVFAGLVILSGIGLTIWARNSPKPPKT